MNFKQISFFAGIFYVDVGILLNDVGCFFAYICILFLINFIIILHMLDEGDEEELFKKMFSSMCVINMIN